MGLYGRCGETGERWVELFFFGGGGGERERRERERDRQTDRQGRGGGESKVRMIRYSLNTI